MFVTHIQKAITYLREAQEIALFTTMADAGLSAAFRASPLFYVMLPFIGLLLTANALINGYRLAKASNRNFDRWFLFITSAACAALASISLYGAALSVLLNFSFAAGPWFFFSSLIVASSHQLMMFGLNLFRAYESPKNSIQRMHYIQAAFSNLFATAFLASALGAVVFVLLFPIIPAVGSAFSITAVLFTAFDILWRMTPYDVKKLIKGWLHLSKPDANQDAMAHQQEILKLENAQEMEPKHHRMFTCCDYSALIRTMDLDEAKPYLLRLIQQRLHILRQNEAPEDGTIKDKIKLLTAMSKVMHHPTEISKKDMLRKYPLAFQSFWAEKGDVEQIVDAVIVFKSRYRTPEVNRSLLNVIG